MIPKIIHYCWFGGKELSELAKKCLASWKKYCPDYEIKCWNESNFDINSNRYVKEAYENKKYAFVTDYVRLYALYKEGGIYVDTDLEIIKPLDEFLKDRAFSGFENEEFVACGIIGAERKNNFIKEMLEWYEKNANQNDKLNFIPNPQIMTELLIKNGLTKNGKYQVVDGVTIYPIEYFYPMDINSKKINLTSKTYSIHWYAGSWIPTKQRVKEKIYRAITAVIGEKNAKKVMSAVKRRKYE